MISCQSVAPSSSSSSSSSNRSSTAPAPHQNSTTPEPPQNFPRTFPEFLRTPPEPFRNLPSDVVSCVPLVTGPRERKHLATPRMFVWLKRPLGKKLHTTRKNCPTVRTMLAFFFVVCASGYFVEDRNGRWNGHCMETTFLCAVEPSNATHHAQPQKL